MPKIIGERIQQVLAALEPVQPCGSGPLANLVPHIDQRNLNKYLNRAVGLGLAKIDRTAKPSQFEVLPDWRHLLLGSTRTAKLRLDVPTPVPVPALADLHPLYAVWAKPLLFTDKTPF